MTLQKDTIFQTLLQIYEEYKGRLLDGQFQTKKEMQQHERQFEISNESCQGIDYADLFFIYVIEPLMYTGICLSVAYGFFDGIHLYNIPTQYVLLLVLGFWFQVPLLEVYLYWFEI